MGRWLLDGEWPQKPHTRYSLTASQGAPIAGYILDASGGPQAGFEAYRPAVYYAGSMTLASTGLIVFVRLRLETSLLSKLGHAIAYSVSTGTSVKGKFEWWNIPVISWLCKEGIVEVAGIKRFDRFRESGIMI